MITDAILTVLSTVGGWLAGALPVHALTVPGAGAVAGVIAKADSLIPVAGVLQSVLVVLGLVVSFMAVRAVLVVWNLLWP